MITVTRQIPDYAHAENPMLLYCQTDNMQAAAGAFAQFRIELDTTATGLADNETVTLNLLNTSITFTAKTAPDASGLQVNVRQMGDSDQQYMERLAQDLHANYILNVNYRYEVTIIGGKWTIVFTARQRGAVYSLDSGTQSVAIFNVSGTNGTDPQLRPSFKLACITWYFGPSGFPEVLGEDRLTPDSQGRAVFDISAWFRSLLRSEYQWPMVNNAVIRFAMSQPYYNTLAEVYGENPVVQKVTQLAPKTVITGALDKQYFEQRYRAYEPYPASQEQFFVTEKDILHDRPFRIEARMLRDNEKIYYISSRAHTLRMKVFFTDGTDQTVNLFTLPFNPDYPLVFEANVSPWFLGVANVQPTKTVKFYRIFANAPSQPSVNLFTPVDIHIDRKKRPRVREFLFRNRRGAYEFIRMYGYFGRQKNHTAEDYENAGKWDNPYSISKYGRFNVEPELVISGNTGPITRLRWLHIREFFETTDLYENVNGRLYGCRMLSTEYESFTDNVFERGVDFRYVRLEEPGFEFDGKCPSGPEIVVVNQQIPIQNLINE